MIIHWLVFSRIERPQDISWSFIARTLENVSDKNLCGNHLSLVKVIWRIEDLATWIRGSADTGVLSTLELAKRAHEIDSSITPFIIADENQLFQKDDEEHSMSKQRNEAKPFSIAVPCYRQSICTRSSSTSSRDAASSEIPTCSYHSHRELQANALLARAAQVFLHIVVSGPNPCLPEIRNAVQGGISLLLQWNMTGDMADYQTFSWPLAVIRSMAFSAEDREKLDLASVVVAGV